MRKHKEKSYGFIMLVVLIALAILSLSAISVKELTVLNEKQTGNIQQKVRVEQVAISEAEKHLSELRANTAVLEATTADRALTPKYNPTSCDSVQPDEVCQTVTLKFEGIGAPPAGYDPASYEGMKFRIESTAQNPATGAVSSYSLAFAHARLRPPPPPPPPPPARKPSEITTRTIQFKYPYNSPTRHARVLVKYTPWKYSELTGWHAGAERTETIYIRRGQTKTWSMTARFFQSIRIGASNGVQDYLSRRSGNCFTVTVTNPESGQTLLKSC